MYSTAHWQLGDVMVSDITFLWFLLFSMCHSLHVAVNKCTDVLNIYDSQQWRFRDPSLQRFNKELQNMTDRLTDRRLDDG